MNIKEFFKRDNLDEMQKQTLLKIESCGFWALWVLLLAALIALIDALPVFGTGTILIPWALVLFLRGQTKTGVGLVVLYGAAALSRQALEPRLVGKQVGLNPVLTLLALYTGYRLLGVGGMIVFPITAMLLKQIWDHSGLQPEG